MSSPRDKASKSKEEEGDVTASLKIDLKDVRVGMKEIKDNDLATSFLGEKGMERYREAFSLLWPDGEGKVHKSRLVKFFETVLAPLYSDDMAAYLVESMKPDEEGNITLESFVQAFSLSHWPPESVAAMHEVLAGNPNLISKLVDWNEMFGRLGMNLSEHDLVNIIEQGRKAAADLLDKELAKSKDHIPNKEEVSKKSSEILNALMQKIHLLDVGGKGSTMSAKVTSAGESTDDSSQRGDEVEKDVEKMSVQLEEHPVELNK